ncbi:MAG: class I SAM-dependent methyltransferase [Pirellulaceae bacterium]
MTGPDLQSLQTYFHLMNLNGSAQVYHTALELGVFDALLREAKSAAQVAQACETREEPTALLLDALSRLGLLSVERSDQQPSVFSLTEVARMILMSEYRELGDQYWRHLPDFLRTGRPMKKMDAAAESEEHYQSRVAMLGWMLSHAAAEAAERLDIGGRRTGLSILDVGAGSGVWSLAMAARDVNTNVTAVDWPAVLEVARETAETLGAQERLQTLSGNFLEVELPAGAFDLAVAANVTHLLTAEQNRSLFEKLHAALRPGGELLIIDALPGSSLGDVPLALYHLGLVLRTENGHVYSPQELRQLLGDRFAVEPVIPLDAPPHVVGMLLARKH